jgi:hypothetical protein
MENKSQKGLLTIIGILVLVILVLIYSSYVKSKGPAVSIRNSTLATAQSTASVTVGNALPVASSAAFGSNDITLAVGPTDTTPVSVSANITDDNGCSDIASANVAVYKDGATCQSSGDANNDTCYFATIASSSADFHSCNGNTRQVSHTFNFQYYAQPGTWHTTITPSDIEAVGTSGANDATVEVTLSLTTDPTLNYGNVAGGSSSQGTNTLAINNLGNTAMDIALQGQDLACTGTNAMGSIPVGDLQYSLTNFSYPSGISLTSSPVFAGQLNAPSQNNHPVSGTSYWQVAVPGGVRGTCSGQITFTATATTTQQGGQGQQGLTWYSDMGYQSFSTANLNACPSVGAGWRLPTKAELSSALTTQFAQLGFVSGDPYWASEGGVAWYASIQNGSLVGPILDTMGGTNRTMCVHS